MGPATNRAGWPGCLTAEPMAEQKLYSDALAPAAEIKGGSTRSGGPADTQVGTDGSSSPTPVLSQLMAHPLISPYKHTSPKGEVRRNPSYLPAPVFAKAMIDLAVEPHHASGTQGLTKDKDGRRDRRGAICSRARRLDQDGGRQPGQAADEPRIVVRRPDGPGQRFVQAMGEALGDPHRHRGGVRLQYRHSRGVTISTPMARVRAAVPAAASSDELCQPVAGDQPTASDCVPDKVEDLEQLQLPVGWTEARWQHATSSVVHLSLKLYWPASHSRGGGARGTILVRCAEPDRFTAERGQEAVRIELMTGR